MNNEPRIDKIQAGNAADDGARGWFVGNFVNKAFGLRKSDDVEIKWGVHKAGEERPEWVTGEQRTAVFVLISGRWEMDFRDRTVVMSKAGDYCMWGKGTDHRWRAVEDSVTMTIRWPSIPDQK